ncbi:unnamed protein product [Camellia sinensis]
MEEFPQLCAAVDQGFENPIDVDLALDYLGKSHGIQRMRELVANVASTTIDSLPKSDDEDVQKSRHAPVNLTHRVITRTK